MDLSRRLRARDPGLAALRRAARAALVMPALFALGEEVLGNPALATFAALGSFALLLLVDFGGSMRDRLMAQAALGVAGSVFVCLGTLASHPAWLAAVAMAMVGFGVLFAGVVSSVLAGATVSLLVAFILPVSLPGPASSIPDRMAGWGLAAALSFLAVAFLWPAPARDPLREAALGACRALARRQRVEAAYLLAGEDRPTAAERDGAVARASESVAALGRVFLATPYRPTGLSTAARTVVRLVDELRWLDAIVNQSPVNGVAAQVDPDVCAVKSAAALVLERGADLLAMRGGPPDALSSAHAELRGALARLEGCTTIEPSVRREMDSRAVDAEQQVQDFVSSLDPSFRAQELGFAVSQIARNVESTAAAERRSWLERMLGRQPVGLAGPLAAAQERAGAHVKGHSVWLHNSVRGAVGLGLAVLVADLSGVQHSFWVVLGTLSVLRSNALSTGQNIVRGLLGTVAGFIVGAALLAVIGTNATVLWLLLPPAILVAGIAPAAVSFAAGQAAFTVALVILFNILEPVGWHVGLLRIEDVALGCAVSLLVGSGLWPRGAAAALGRALAEAYVESSRYFAAAVLFGIDCCDRVTPSRPGLPAEAVRAAAASRRLDDAFRSYLAERGAKPVRLAEMTSLVNGVAGLRLAADAVLDLWQRDDGRSPGDRASARRELRASAEAVTGWYEAFARGLAAGGPIPEPLASDPAAAGRLVDAVRRDLGADDVGAGAVAVRVIWTGDHVDAVRRLQATLVGPARAAAERAPHSRPGAFRPYRLPARGAPLRAPGSG